MPLLTPPSLLLVLCGACMISSVSAASNTEIEPSVIRAGKAATITFTGDEAEKITRVTLAPGGPVLKDHMAINDALLAHFKVNNKLYKGTIFEAQADQGLAITPVNNQKQTPIYYATTGPAMDVALNNHIAFIANGDNGLTLLDISEPRQPYWLSSHQKLGNVIRVVVEEQRALVLNDEGILFFIATDNLNEPTTLGFYRVNGKIRDIALDGELGFVQTTEHIDIIDFSFQSPQISNEGLDFGQGVNFGGERRVFIKEDIAYVADWFSGIHLYDISQPTMPVLLSSYHTPGSAKGIVVRDGVAYIADDDHGLHIADIRDPRKPKQIAILQTAGLAYTPKLVGDLLFLASHSGGFQIIDIKNPARPTLISNTKTPGKAWSIEIKDQLAYVADDDSGLLIYDVHNPVRPQLIAQFNPGGAAEEIIVRDNIAYVAFFENGLYLLDISNPRRPVQLSHTNIPGNTRGLDLVGDTLYVASWLAGVHILDVRQIKRPRILGSYDTRGATWGLKVKDDFLYAMDWWGGIAVLDINNPKRPLFAGSYHHRGRVEDIAAAGNYAFVAYGDNGLQVFDINNPLNPTWTTGTNFPGNANKITLHDNHAYIAAGAAGLAVVDISNQFHVRWLGNHSSRGDAIDVAIIANTAIVLNKDGNISSYNLKTSSTPQHTSQLPLNALAISQSGQDLVVATENTLRRYQTDKGKLKLISTQPLSFRTEHMSISNGLLAASSDKQIRFFDISSTSLVPVKTLSLESVITSIHFDAEALYLSCGEEIVTIDNVFSNATITSRHKTLGHMGELTLHRDTLYSSGDETIRAIRKLARVTVEADAESNTQFNSPSDLSEGHYSLIINKSSNTEILKNALKVTMPRFSKPKLSLDAFKKLMEQKKNTDLFNHH